MLLTSITIWLVLVGGVVSVALAAWAVLPAPTLLRLPGAGIAGFVGLFLFYRPALAIAPIAFFK